MMQYVIVSIRTPGLYMLHNRLFDVLTGMVTIKIPEHNRAGYMPHVSNRPTAQILPHNTVTLESASPLEYSNEALNVVATIKCSSSN